MMRTGAGAKREREELKKGYTILECVSEKVTSY